MYPQHMKQEGHEALNPSPEYTGQTHHLNKPDCLNCQTMTDIG